MLKMYLIFKILRLIGAFVGTARVVQTINKYSLYRHLLPIKEKHLTDPFQVPSFAKASSLPSSEWTHFRPHGNL